MSEPEKSRAFPIVGFAVAMLVFLAGVALLRSKGGSATTVASAGSRRASSDEPSEPGSLAAKPERRAPAPGPALGSAPSRISARDKRHRDEVRESVYRHLGVPPPAPARAATRAATRADSLPQSPGVLDKDYIQTRIRSDFIPLARECYEALLAKQPSVAGKAVFSFTIVGDEDVGGIVESAELDDGSTLTDEEFATCVRESLLSVTFDPPRKGGWVTVTYPIDFSPDPEPPASAPK